MAIGPVVRSFFGPFERPVSEFYRAFFVDIKALVRQTSKWVNAENILELGCGEGSVTELLVSAYPNAQITGIDITPRVGRMFQGDLTRVVFKQQTIQDFVKENYPSYDLLIISDVIHHVPWDMQKELLAEAKNALKPGAYVILKDWEYSPTLIHLLNYLADRYITGDPVRHRTADEFRELIGVVFGSNSIKAETRIAPWSNNITFLIQI